MSPTIVDSTASSPAATRLSDELALKTAILHSQPERLRVTLQETCNSSPEAFLIARSLLLVPEEQVKHKAIDRRNRTEDDADQDDEDEDEDEEDCDDAYGEEDDGGDKKEEEDRPRVFSDGVAVTQTNGVKRLRPKFATCTNCSGEFDVTDNGKDSCIWHPGKSEPASWDTQRLNSDSLGDREADYESELWRDHDECWNDFNTTLR
ncbi:MAG: hypothetical protein ALECFALPRED_008713 [Alectoria fallacina]|uniref:Uncharacterized protein n=1 Tax=Alectoria fallacina TaxID=1903189 RepID=A0A8H3J4G2_9LECA|nr:MAG: hypothetical protein ALECFALPRED_008713 [Alectoria fallacina]